MEHGTRRLGARQIAFAVGGALGGIVTLCLGSAIQKTIIGAPVLLFRGYIVPLVYGGFVGCLLGLWLWRLRATARRLAESEARQRFIFEATDAGLLLLDDRWRIVAANPAFRRIMRCDTDDTVGADWHRCLPRAIRESVDRARIEDLVEGDIHPVDLRRDDGSTVPVEVCVKRTDWMDMPHVLLAVHDVSTSRNLERRYRGLHERLLRGQKLEALGLMAGSVVHDVNNLLAAIRGFAETAADSIGDNRRAQKDLSLVEKASVQAGRLTQRLLAFSRGQRQPARQCDPAEVVDSYGDMLRRLAEPEVTVVIDCDAEAGRVPLDRERCEQILLNLCVNSREAMADGGLLSISVSGLTLDSTRDCTHGDLDAGTWVVLRVRDTGRGMDEATRQRLFEPFFTARKYNGTGLGLATVRDAVDNAGGAIDVESAPGGGTTFSVYLPRVGTPAARKPAGAV